MKILLFMKFRILVGMYIKNKELQDNIEYILNKLELEEKDVF